MPFLVFLRDKSILFDEERQGFVMYAVQGRTWVALGDPVGADERMPALIQMFLERCDDFGGVPVFYEVASEHLHRYADVGLTFVKLGEEARIDLTSFTLEGSDARRYRQVLRHFEKEHAAFRIVPPEDVPGIGDRLRSVSDEWLSARAAARRDSRSASLIPPTCTGFRWRSSNARGRS
jgi:phosphatidylglycerol lysyltransferase